MATGRRVRLKRQTVMRPPMTPYYADDLVELYHGDVRNLLPHVIDRAAVMVTDPPYGIGWSSGHEGVLPRSIEGDGDSMLRDWVLEQWFSHGSKVDYTRPALVFGSWKVERPDATRQVLIWDSQGALGMGALDLPWKPAHQEIYVIGKGFKGYRGTDVLSYHPEQATARRGRLHPHQKPLPLLRDLIQKCPDGVILDPFAGVASTLVAAKSLNRKAIGIEIDADYCRKGAGRLSQEVMRLPTPSDLRGLVTDPWWGEGFRRDPDDECQACNHHRFDHSIDGDRPCYGPHGGKTSCDCRRYEEPAA